MPRSQEEPPSQADRHRARRGLAWCFAATFVLTLSVPTSADWLELEARYWAPSLGGGSAVTVDGSSVGLDLERDLGLDVDESLEGRLTIRPGLGIFFRARLQNLAAAGAQTADLDIVLGGIDVQLLVDTESVLDFDYGAVALGWQFTSPSGKLRIGPFAEAKGVRGDASIRLSAFGVTQSFAQDFEAAFGAVGGLLEIQPTDSFQIFAEVSVLVESDDADLTEAEIGVRYFPTDLLGLGVGYRSLQLDGTIDGVPLDLDYEGAFGSLLLRF